uniref:DUF5107 domain-containing protein n=1 Tax=uncultured Draconibacterium sp. TaxID=1573823 RepID=UPI003216E1F0
MKLNVVLFFYAVLFLFSNSLLAQNARIFEKKMMFKTYPYSDPDPVAKMTKFYPYYRFDGMTVNSTEKEWNFVVLENDYIIVYVAPEMGGKVWGAIEKSTGRDFIYFNNEVKFRDIAMRGAWTSGGIEFNFGSIGHAPSTASPVNYKMVENNDGSVSCFVGAPDLTSRTEWRVEVRLPADKAYFETKGFWYNPTGERTSLYNWMTASTDVSDDLEFIFPGHGEISHGGDYNSWPVDDKGRNISFYRNNDFGGSKSYHILGSYEEYFSTFFHDSNFGMGHWAPREERPGMKVFLWALSRQGAIWHNLLTDPETNPQYTELQTGFLFNQEAKNSTYSPYKHMFFDGGSENGFSEIWFPVKGTNGMLKADAYGTLNVVKNAEKATLKFCALQNIKGELVVRSDEKVVMQQEVDLKPLDLFEGQFNLPGNAGYSVDIADVFSYKSTEHQEKLMSRPTVLGEQFNWESAEGIYTEAVELEKQRYYSEALEKYGNVLEKEPLHSRALTGKANILFKKMDYNGAGKASMQALSINTYDPDANFIYGMTCDRLGKTYDALEAFGLAMRSVKYRSAANLEMARIYYRTRDFNRAIKYANQSLDYNRNNTEAYVILALIENSNGNEKEKQKYLDEILKLDPLNTFAACESENFKEVLHFEMPAEIGLELAIKYYSLGEIEKAKRLLENFNDHSLVKFWLAYMADDTSLLNDALAASPEFVYPFRSETATVLEWALSAVQNWKAQYYLALLHWHKGNIEKAEELFLVCGNASDYAPFYITRGDFQIKTSPEKSEQDYLKALSLDAAEWRIYQKLVNFYNLKEDYQRALQIASDAYKKFPESYIAGYDYALSLCNNGEYLNSLKVLGGINILPNEGARSGHKTYRKANIFQALDYYKKGNYKKAVNFVDEARKWPENLGVGRPKVTDERIEDFLQWHCYKRGGNKIKAEELKKRIIDQTLSNIQGSRTNSTILLSALVLKEDGQVEKADQIMEEWLSANTKNKTAQWAMAVYSGDTDNAQKLSENIKEAGKGTPWNPVQNDDTFELVKELYMLK